MHHFFRSGLSKLLPSKIFLRLQFWRSHGYFPNLRSPRTFNEKIQWLKLYGNSELKTITSDKYLVRNYIKNLIGSECIIPIYFETKDVNDLNSKNVLNFPCIIKANHDSGSCQILIDDASTDWKNIRQFYKTKLRTDYSLISKEWQYKNIERRVIIEEYLQDKQGNLPIDLKVYCFNGEARYIALDFDRGKHSKCRNWYDINWNRIEVSWGDRYDMRYFKSPEFLNELIESSNKLSEPFYFLRVDWFILDEKFYIGELTHSPGGGMEGFKPKKWDNIFGDHLKLPI